MKILVIAATDSELVGIRQACLVGAERPVRTLVTGVGLLAAAYAIMQEIACSRPDLILQTGIAGCFNKKYSLGTAVAVEREIFADMGVHEDNTYHDLFDLGLADENMAPFETKAVINHHKDLLSAAGLPTVSAVSVNEISSSLKRIALFSDGYKADIESMEGAALHYVCSLQKIPFIQIRGISNMVGERNKSRWKIQESLDAAAVASVNLINKLEQP